MRYLVGTFIVLVLAVAPMSIAFAGPDGASDPCCTGGGGGGGGGGK
jgi:hypothetical protein